MKRALYSLGILLILAGCQSSPITPPPLPIPSQPAATASPTEQIISPSPTPSATATIIPIPTEAQRIINFPVADMPQSIKTLFFVDPTHGWLVGSRLVNPKILMEGRMIDVSVEPRLYVLAVTEDGGATWQPTLLPYTDVTVDRTTSPGLFFLDQDHGWFLYHGLYSTSDGGKTWKEEHPQGSILSLNRIPDGTGYALFETTNGVSILDISISSAETWASWGNHFPAKVDQIALANSSTAWMIGSEGDNSGKGWKLLRTKDKGQSWEELLNPCALLPKNFYKIAVVDANHLWIGCGSWGAGPWGEKSLFYSSDGGDTWELRGFADLPPASNSTMSSYGYLMDIQVPSANTVYLSQGRGMRLQLTRDGGNTWESSGRLPEFVAIFFINSEVGWAYDQLNVFRTIDGGRHWKTTDFSTNSP